MREATSSGVVPLDCLPRRCRHCREETSIGHGRRHRPTHDDRHWRGSPQFGEDVLLRATRQVAPAISRRPGGLAWRARPGRERVDFMSTRYMDAALNHRKSQGHEPKQEDLARLSPLRIRHFNVPGGATSPATDSVLKGEMRPLRNPAAPHEVEDCIDEN